MSEYAYNIYTKLQYWWEEGLLNFVRKIKTLASSLYVIFKYRSVLIRNFVGDGMLGVGGGSNYWKWVHGQFNLTYPQDPAHKDFLMWQMHILYLSNSWIKKSSPWLSDHENNNLSEIVVVSHQVLWSSGSVKWPQRNWSVRQGGLLLYYSPGW